MKTCPNHTHEQAKAGCDDCVHYFIADGAEDERERIATFLEGHYQCFPVLDEYHRPVADLVRQGADKDATATKCTCAGLSEDHIEPQKESSNG